MDNKTNENLEIHNFCGIKNAKININEFLILIGPQSSGKSIISKIVYWSRQVISSIYYEVVNGGTFKNIIKEAKVQFNRNFIYSTNSDFDIQYNIGGLSISVQVSTRKTLKISFNEALQDVINDFVKITRSSPSDEDGPLAMTRKRRDDRRYLIDSLLKISNDRTLERGVIYAPAARSFFSQIEDSLYVFLASSNRLDPTMETFGDYLKWAKESAERRLKAVNTEFLDLLFSHVLKGKYVRTDKQDFIQHKDGRVVPLASASSGQQETLPLCLILNNLISEGSFGRMLIIEEPEAHLHPRAQRTIVEAIVHTGVTSFSPIILTTHSPYVLSVINNLLLTNMVKMEHPEEYKQRNLEKSLIFGSSIGKDKISAYCINSGEVHSLIDEETSLIKADMIDEVSHELSENFDHLLEII